MIGRVDMNEDEVAANFSFLTVEEGQKDSGVVRSQRMKTESGADQHANKVFMWGLNDRTQLGSGVAETKVKIPYDSKALAKLRPVQLVGGSKTLFVISQDGKVRTYMYVGERLLHCRHIHTHTTSLHNILTITHTHTHTHTQISCLLELPPFPF